LFGGGGGAAGKGASSRCSWTEAGEARELWGWCCEATWAMAQSSKEYSKCLVEEVGIALASGAVLRKEQVRVGALRQAGTAKIRVCLSRWGRQRGMKERS